MRYLWLISIFIFIIRGWYLPRPILLSSSIMQGTIVNIPAHQTHHWQFIFLVNKQRLWVNWYGAPAGIKLRVGDAWQLALIIKPTKQRWLQEKHIFAIATVSINWHNQILLQRPWYFPINHLRTRLANDISRALIKQKKMIGFISALSVGIRDQITLHQWQDLRNTGTNHLMAIAGLHIGLVTACSYYLFNFLWRGSRRLLLWRPAQEAASLFAWLIALFYSLLSGFALPAQRAFIMLTVFLWHRCARRHFSLWASWRVALGVILIYEPLAVFTASFWLSFGAVALLIYCHREQANLRYHWIHAQWVMAIGLMPLTLLLFKQLSWVSFFANVIAVPFVSFLILPLCLIADMCALIHLKIASFLWQSSAWALGHFWSIIHVLAQLPHGQWQHTVTQPWLLLPAMIGVLILLAPKGFPARWLRLLWLLPMIIR